MNCHNTQNLLSAYLDGEVRPDISREMEAHLQACAACRAELGLLQQLDRSLATLPAPAVPDVTFRVLNRVRRPARPWWRSLSMAASLVLGLVLGASLAGNFYPNSLYLVNDNAEVLALEEVLQDFPQDSWGRSLLSYQDDEENGA
jgi:anti-sigma factor RsiW